MTPPKKAAGKRSAGKADNSGLPALTALDWEVRTVAYRHFARLASAPTAQILRKRLEVDRQTVVESLKRLEAHRQLALFPDRDEIWIANPFSAVPTPFRVQTPYGRHWAACAWDALGIPAIVEDDGAVETQCPGSGEDLRFGVRDGKVNGDDCVIHLVVPLAQAWDDIGFT